MPHKPSDKRTDHRGHGKRNINPGTFGRLLSQMGAHRFKLVLVLLCILLSALSRASTSLFLRALIDDEIMPMIAQGVVIFRELFVS